MCRDDVEHGMNGFVVAGGDLRDTCVFKGTQELLIKWGDRMIENTITVCGEALVDIIRTDTLLAHLERERERERVMS